MPDLIQRGVFNVEVNSDGVASGVEKGVAAFEKLETAATGAAQKTDSAIKGVAGQSEAAAGKLDSTTRGFINSIQRQTAAADAGSKSNADYIRALAALRGVDVSVLEPYLKQLERVQAEARQAKVAVDEFSAATRLTQGLSQAARVRVVDDPVARGLSAAGRQASANNAASLAAAAATDRLTDATRRGAIVFNEYGLSAKQTQAALRQVPAQLTDIVVSLQGGQNPLTVFLQQGGQLRDVFGGAVPALRALGGAVLGLINPFTLAAAAIGALSAGYFFGSKEADAYAKSLILTGNAAGSTVDELAAISVSVAAVAGTQANAAAALAQVAGSGEVAAGSLQKVTLAAVQLERNAGVAVADTVKQFAELGKAPTEASIRLNQQYRFLTASVYEQIRALEQQGRATEAAKVAQDAFSDSLLNRADELERRLGSIERGWIFVKDAIKGAADALLDIGRADTIGQQIASLQSQRSALLQAASPEESGVITESTQRELTAIESRISALQKENEVRTASARIEAQRGEETEKGIAAIKAIEAQAVSLRTNQERLNATLQEYRRNLDAIRAANPDDARLNPAAIAEQERRIRASFATRSAAPASRAQRSERVDVSDIRRELDQLTGAYRSAESILDAVRQAGLVSESEYYDAKRQFLTLNSQAQVAALEEENNRLAQAKVIGDEIIARDNKIADNKARIAIIEANAAAQSTLLGIRQAQAARNIELAYQQARAAAEDLLQAQILAEQRDAEGAGLGNAERDRIARENAIRDRFAERRAQIERDRQNLRLQQGGTINPEQDSEFERLLALQREFEESSVAVEQSRQDRISRQQADFAVGASEAFNNYLDSARDVAAQTEELFSNAFKGMEDALVQFVQTGKLDFNSLAGSIVNDIIRIIIQQQLANAVAAASPYFRPGSGGAGGFLGSVIGAVLGTPGRAAGGPVTAGQPYTVGEFGRELFVPSTSGTIIPAAQTEQIMSGGTTVNAPINIAVSGMVDRRTREQIAADVQRAVGVAVSRGTA
jgi:lambda family phage tail tape measure protein